MTLPNNLFKIAFIFIAFSFATAVTAQNIEKCKKIVAITAEGINNKSSAKLTSKLAPEFEIANQKGEIAKMVLNQLIAQLGDTVERYEEISSTKTNNGLALKYNFYYNQRGPVETSFVFNKKNQLKELGLFNMQVKTMSGDTQVERNNNNTIEIPFEMAGNLILVDVVLNGKNKKFVLDSGSPRVILNAKYLPKTNANQRTMTTSNGVNGSINGMDIGHVENLDFAGIKMENQEVITLDISHLEENLNTEIHGLIGYDLIQSYDVLFDYENKKITLINPEYFEAYKSTHLARAKYEVISFSLQHHIPVITATINNTSYTLGIDCGAESNLINKPHFNSLKNTLTNITTDSLLGADNNPVAIHTAEVKNMKIGNKSFKDLVTAFSDISHLNQGYGLSLDGLIGYEVLSKQKTIISFQREELIFIQ